MKETLKPLEPISPQDAVNELCDYLLGKDWYVVDPLGVSQVNALIVDEIKRWYYPHRNSKYGGIKNIVKRIKWFFDIGEFE